MLPPVIQQCRNAAIKLIMDLSMDYTQEELDEKVVLCVDDGENGYIGSMFMGQLIGIDVNLCYVEGTSFIKLGDMTKETWITWKV